MYMYTLQHNSVVQLIMRWFQRFLWKASHVWSNWEYNIYWHNVVFFILLNFVS